MAKKLTRETLEKMVMQVMNEAYVQQPSIDVGARASTLFGRKPSLPKSGEAEKEAVQFLRMLLSEPKLPNNIKDQIEDFLSYEKSTPETETSTDWDLETLPTANVQAITDETPTVKMSQAEKDVAQKKTAGSAYSSPQGVTAPTGRPAAPSLPMSAPKKKSFLSRFFEGNNELESLVMEALEEMGMQSYLGSTGDRMKTPFTAKNRAPQSSMRSTAVLPTVKEDPTPKLAADEKPTVQSLSTRGRKPMPSQEYYKKVGGKYPDAAAESKLESLVAEVMAEMSKKKPVKDTKKPVKK